MADEAGNSLTVIDAATDTVATTLTGITGPHNVQVGSDGAAVYAVSSNQTVMVIDPATYAVTTAAATGSAPAHVIEAPNGKVYVTNSGDGTVSVYRMPGLAAAGRIQLGGMPHGLRPAADGSIIVVANTAAGELDLIDPSTDRFVGAVPVGAGPAQVAVSADGRYAYTGIAEPAAVVRVDLRSRTVVGSARVPAAPVQVYLTSDGATLVSADQGTRANPGHDLSVVDTAAMTLLGNVHTGAGPHGAVIDTSSARAWVTNTFDDTVSVIDLSNLSESATLRVGKAPSGISYSPRPPAAAGTAVTRLTLPAPDINQPGGISPHDHGHH